MPSALDYISKINEFSETQEFLSSPIAERESALRQITDSYLNDVEDENEREVIKRTAQDINSFSKGINGTYRKPISQEDLAYGGFSPPDLSKAKDKEEALSMIDDARENNKLASYDYLNRDDFQFQVDRNLKELRREVNGEDTGRIADLGYRTIQGAIGGGMRLMGLSDAADEFETNYLPENVKYDQEFISKLAQGGGDFVSSITLFLAAQALSGGSAGVGMAASLAANATRRYQDSYKQVFADTGNEYMANEAGINAMPAAAIETLADTVVAGRFFGKQTKPFMQAIAGKTGEEQGKILAHYLKDTSLRRSFVEGFLAEGTGEAAGDAVADLGMVAATGNKDYSPKGKELWESFIIGGLLGGPVSATGQFISNFGEVNSTLRENRDQINSLLKEKNYQGVTDLFQSKFAEKVSKGLDEDGNVILKEGESMGDLEKRVVSPDNLGNVTLTENKEEGKTEDNKEGKKEELDLLTVINQKGEKVRITPTDLVSFRELRENLNKENEVAKLEEDRANYSGNRFTKGNERSRVRKEIQEREDSINRKLPNRKRFFDEVDNTESTLTPEEKSSYKRIIDYLALARTSNTGLSMDSFYEKFSMKNMEEGKTGKEKTGRGRLTEEGDGINQLNIELKQFQDENNSSFPWENSMDAIGAVPNQVDVNYFGFILPMSHSQFRQLVPKGVSGEETNSFLRGEIENGKKVAPPFLQVEWDNENKVWRTTGHEGRSRADLSNELDPNGKIPVAILPYGMRARNITEEMRNAPIIPESGGDAVFINEQNKLNQSQAVSNTGLVLQFPLDAKPGDKLFGKSITVDNNGEVNKEDFLKKLRERSSFKKGEIDLINGVIEENYYNSESINISELGRRVKEKADSLITSKTVGSNDYKSELGATEEEREAERVILDSMHELESGPSGIKEFYSERDSSEIIFSTELTELGSNEEYLISVKKDKIVIYKSRPEDLNDNARKDSQELTEDSLGYGEYKKNITKEEFNHLKRIQENLENYTSFIKKSIKFAKKGGKVNLASERFQGVNPKPIGEMPNLAETVIQEPEPPSREVKTDWGSIDTSVPKFEESIHKPAGESNNVIGFSRQYDAEGVDEKGNKIKGRFLFEVQSDWASKIRKGLARAKEKAENLLRVNKSKNKEIKRIKKYEEELNELKKFITDNYDLNFEEVVIPSFQEAYGSSNVSHSMWNNFERRLESGEFSISKFFPKGKSVNHYNNIRRYFLLRDKIESFSTRNLVDSLSLGERNRGNLDFKSEDINELIRQEEEKVLLNSSAFNSNYESILIKDAIVKAKADGLDHIIITDAETAMMTERHDAYPETKNIAKKTENGKQFNVKFDYADPTLTVIKISHIIGSELINDSAITNPTGYDESITTVVDGKEYDALLEFENGEKYAYSKNSGELVQIDSFKEERTIKQEKGMRAAYDPNGGRLHSIARKITGDKGVKVDLGNHQYESDFFNKNNVTGIAYKISDVDSSYLPLFQKGEKGKEVVTNNQEGKVEGKKEKIGGTAIAIDKEGKMFLPKKNEDLSRAVKGLIEISRTNGNMSTFMHESIHVMRITGLINDTLTADELTAFEKAANVDRDENGEAVWTVDAEEKVARHFEAWLRNPAYTKSLDKIDPLISRVFNKVKRWMQGIYKNLKESRLPYQTNKRGATVPNIHPDFASTFEKLFRINEDFRYQEKEPNLGVDKENLSPREKEILLNYRKGQLTARERAIKDQLNIKSQEKAGDESQTSGNQDNSSQNASQLGSVNPQLMQTGGQGDLTGDTVGLTEDELSAVYTPTEDDKRAVNQLNKLNIKLNKKGLIRTNEDRSVASWLKELRKFSQGLHRSEEDSVNYYQILNNFFSSRKKGDTPEGRVNSENAASALAEMRGRVAQLWFEWKAKKFGVDVSSTPFDSEEVGGTYQSAIDFLRGRREEMLDGRIEPSAAEGEEEVNPYIALAEEHQRWIRDQLEADPSLSSLPLLPSQVNGELSKLRSFQEKFINYLTSISPQEILDSFEDKRKGEKALFDFFVSLDSLVTDGTFVGGKDMISRMTDSFFEQMNVELGGFRNQFSAISPKAITKLVTGLSGLDTNIRRLSLVEKNISFLRSIGNEMEEGFNEQTIHSTKLKDKLKKVRDELFGKKFTNYDRALIGVASKIMQTHSDLTQADKDAEVMRNKSDLEKGFNEMLLWDHLRKNGELNNSILSQLTSHLGDEFTQAQFIESFRENFPLHYQWINEMSDYMNEYKDAYKFVTEFFHGQPFREVDYYLPTEVLPNDENSVTVGLNEMDSSTDEYTTAMNNRTLPFEKMPRSSQLGTSKQRSGLPEGYHYNTNAEATALVRGNTIFLDIFTTPGRKLAKARLQDKRMEQTLGSKTRAKFIADRFRDQVDIQLREYVYRSDLERFVNGMISRMARTSLSSIHQIVSQPIAAFIHHIIRNPKAVSYYPLAMKISHALATAKSSGIYNEQMSGWRNLIDGSLEMRHPQGDPSLDVSRDLAKENSMFARMFDNEISNVVREVDDKVGKALFSPIKYGDLYPTRVMLIAEILSSMENRTGKRISAMDQIDSLSIPSDVVNDANFAIDENVNVSKNSRRGSILARPGAAIKLLTAFSNHRINISTGVALRLRNIREGLMTGDMDAVKEGASYIAAAAAQSVFFTIAKSAVAFPIAYGISRLALSEAGKALAGIDDEDDREMEILKKEVNQFLQEKTSKDALIQSSIRDLSGNLLWFGAFGGLDSFMFGTFVDPAFKESFDKDRDDLAEKLKKDKRNLQVLGDREGAALIQDHIDLVEAQRYIPLSFQNTGYLEVGGAVRSTAQPFAQFGREMAGSIVENKEFDVTEFITLMKGMGYGQSEISKTVALFERIQNSIYEKDQRKRERDEKNGKKENKSNVNSFKTDFEFQIK